MLRLKFSLTLLLPLVAVFSCDSLSSDDDGDDNTSADDFICSENCEPGVVQLAAYDVIDAVDYPGATLLVEAVTIDASRTQCVAPCGVHFNAELLTDFEVELPFHHLSYHWNFDDADAYFRSLNSDFPFDADANRAQGPMAAHVFETPGTYNVTLNLASKAGYYSNETIEIVVQAPESAFSAEETLCISSSSDFTDCPSGAAEFTSWDSAALAFADMDNAYVLLRAGDVFTPSSFTLIRDGEFVLTRFGDGDDPVIELNGSFSLLHVQEVSAMSVAYIEFQGDYSGHTGLGDMWDSTPIYFGYGGLGSNHVTQYRNTISGVGYCLTPRAGDAHVYADNDCSNWRNFGSLHTSTTRTAYVGNSIRQPLDIISGPDGKESSMTTHTGDGSTATFAYDFEVIPVEGYDQYTSLAHLSDLEESDIDASIVSNLAVRVIESDVEYELVQDVDYTHDTDAQTVTLNSAPASGASVELFHRRWADHGPIRSANSHELVIAQNDLYAKNGWFGNGGSHQPAFRYNSDGDANHSGVIVENRMEGGTMVAIFESANPGIAMGSNGSILVERNIFLGSSSTYYSLRSGMGGITIRNNYIYQPNVQTHTNPLFTGIYMFENYEEGNGTDPANFDQPVEIYNNTIINLADDSIGDEGQLTYTDFEDVVNEDNHEGTAPIFTDMEVNNQISYAPLANLSQYHDDPQLDEFYFVADPSLHAADAPNLPGLFDTLWGFMRSDQTLNGATEQSVDSN